MQEIITFILGGGRGEGLYPLTRYRSVPAVTVAGKYRLIDIPISNCINSGLRRIYVLTQFLSVSLHRHIANTYKFAPFSRGHVEVLAAQQTNEAADWYQGTADAVRQNLRYLGHDDHGDLLILSADGLYRMNYAELARAHRAGNADVTIAVVLVGREQASKYGIVRVDAAGRVQELVEKPTASDVLASLEQPGGGYLANMGVYLCRREFLTEQLRARPRDMDLVTQHFAGALATHRVQAYRFTGYWQDLGSSIRAYHESNLALASSAPPFDFHDPNGVIYTHMRNLPASRCQAGHVESSLISEGCLIEPEARLERSVIGQRARIGRGAVLRDTVVCGADRYEPAEATPGGPPVGIGPGSVIERAIVDKGSRIGSGVRALANGRAERADGENYVIRDGIVVIPKGAVVPDGAVI